jgi:NAD(P)-dependent dehydrogenase (short-subunit alcohol dehydrogenase family)
MKPVILITGASRGIGAATAIKAANSGYAVCVNYRQNHDAACALLNKIRSTGGTAIKVAADISDEKSVVSLFSTIDKELGHVKALVNNAGILEQQMQLEAMCGARIERIFKTNVIGAFLCAREAVKRMSTDNGGTGGAIVNVSSKAACLGSANEYIDYAASKGAIDTLTVGLSREVAGQGIRVNAVRPGFIYTEMHADGGDPDRVKRIASTLPLQRGGTAEEVANAIIWLLSDEASYVTGSFIDASGGR